MDNNNRANIPQKANMKIGIPGETKILEGRVGLIPVACSQLVAQGHQVFVQQDAGSNSGYSDDDYIAVGASIAPDAASLYGEADLIVKVKEPTEQDLQYLRKEHILFCYLHLAANTRLVQSLCDIGLTAVAFETVTDAHGGLPCLAPMSEIAGSLAVQIGANLLHQPQGGRGILLGGLPSTARGHVVVLGAGKAGGTAARLASDMGALVTVFDKNRERLEALHHLSPNITTLYPYQDSISKALRSADLLVGAVLLPGLHTPRLVTRDQVSQMPAGSVIIDISVDQGGCVETIHPTDYANPTYKVDEVLHFGVTNMPGAVPRTASQALSSVIMPYVQRLCEPGWELQDDLLHGINIRAGRVDNPLIAQALQAKG